jgi:hypothetical protein
VAEDAQGMAEDKRATRRDEWNNPPSGKGGGKGGGEGGGKGGRTRLGSGAYEWPSSATSAGAEVDATEAGESRSGLRGSSSRDVGDGSGDGTGDGVGDRRNLYRRGSRGEETAAAKEEEEKEEEEEEDEEEEEEEEAEGAAESGEAARQRSVAAGMARQFMHNSMGVADDQGWFLVATN